MSGNLDYTGQMGNTVPLEGLNSTDTLLLDYQLRHRRPVVVASTATAVTVTSTMSGALITYGGAGSGVTITLPTPEPGLWFEFAATGAITSAATIITCGTTGAFVTAGDSGGCDALVAEATSSEFTATEGGLYVEIVGLSTTQYLVRQWSGGSSVASTAQFKISS